MLLCHSKEILDKIYNCNAYIGHEGIMKADDVHISFIGLNSLHLGVADMSESTLKNLNECVMRIAVFSEDKKECMKIIPEISPMQLNGPPGASFLLHGLIRIKY